MTAVSTAGKSFQVAATTITDLTHVAETMEGLAAGPAGEVPKIRKSLQPAIDVLRKLSREDFESGQRYLSKPVPAEGQSALQEVADGQRRIGAQYDEIAAALPPHLNSAADARARGENARKFADALLGPDTVNPGASYMDADYYAVQMGLNNQARAVRELVRNMAIAE